MEIIFLTGTAGSGKSTLTEGLLSWYREKQREIIAVNLDPGASSLPYQADVDIRDMIDIETIMESYSLGPNGALIFATDMVASRVGEVQDQIDELNPDVVLVDTPGQIELFAFRESGPFITKSLQADSKVALFMIDSAVATSPTNFLSLALLSAAVKLRINLPLIPILSKIDATEKYREVVTWTKNPTKFQDALTDAKLGEEYTLYSQLFSSLRKTSFAIDLYPVSSYTKDGFVSLIGELSRMTEGGEEVED